MRLSRSPEDLGLSSLENTILAERLALISFAGLMGVTARNLDDSAWTMEKDSPEKQNVQKVAAEFHNYASARTLEIDSPVEAPKGAYFGITSPEEPAVERTVTELKRKHYPFSGQSILETMHIWRPTMPTSAESGGLLLASSIGIGNGNDVFALHPDGQRRYRLTSTKNVLANSLVTLVPAVEGVNSSSEPMRRYMRGEITAEEYCAAVTEDAGLELNLELDKAELRRQIEAA